MRRTRLATTPPPAVRVLVFSKTSGFRHSSIAVGGDAIEQLGIANGFAVDRTEDAAAFTASQLAAYDAVVFLSTTGDVLDPEQQGAFEGYIRNGGGLRRHPFGGRHRVRLDLVRRSRRRVLPQPSGTAGCDVGGRGSRARVDLTPRRHVEPLRRVVRLPRRSPRTGARAVERRSADPPRQPDDGRSPDRMVPRLRRRACVVHGARTHRRVMGRPGIPSARPRWHPDRRRRRPGRLFAARRRRRSDVDRVEHIVGGIHDERRVRRRPRTRRPRPRQRIDDDDHVHDRDSPVAVESTSDESSTRWGTHRGRRRWRWC